MATGFEGDVEGAALGAQAGLAQGNDFGMRPAGLAVRTLTDNLTAGDNDGADHGIGTGEAPPLRRETKGQGHVLQIARRRPHRFVRLDRPTTRLLLGLAFTDARVGAFLAVVGFIRVAVLDWTFFGATFFGLAFSASASANAACAAANRAIPTR